MIKVLHFGLSANKGGIETYLRKLWENIDHKEFHFSFLDMTGEGNLPCFYEALKEAGCDFYKITPRKVSVKKNKADLQMLFQEHQFDILHFHVNTLSYITPVLVALKYGCKVIVHSRSAGSSKRLITRFFHHINKLRIGKLDITRIGVSKQAAEWLFGHDVSSVVYNNGIEIPRFTFCKEDRAVARAELGSEHRLVIGNVGAFLPAKNHRFIIDVFEQVCRRREDAVLWLVGAGNGQDDIEQYVKKRELCEKVKFLGSRNDMSCVYAGMDVFLFPSLFEGFPNAVLEAQCEGLPCLMSDCITDEVLLAENAYRLSLNASAITWAEELLRVADSQYTDRLMGAQRVGDAGFSVQQEILRIEKLYQDEILRRD